ncbi:MAG: hypothetical protein P8M25_02545 [Paracoccaceae bacterium]|nr:hypothetical protein [Paracoccaceae bacterium]
MKTNTLKMILVQKNSIKITNFLTKLLYMAALQKSSRILWALIRTGSIISEYLGARQRPRLSGHLGIHGLIIENNPK